jgi:hypothetical protein
MFLRRIFYDAATGEVQCGYTMEGAIAPFTQERDAEVRGLTGCACMEWTTPNPEIEAAFAPVDAEGDPRAVFVTVDVSGAEPRLVFAYEPMPEPGTNEAADMAAALALLGVAPEEG